MQTDRARGADDDERKLERSSSAKTVRTPHMDQARAAFQNSRREARAALRGQRVTDASAASPTCLEAGSRQAVRVLGHTPGHHCGASASALDLPATTPWQSPDGLANAVSVIAQCRIAWIDSCRTVRPARRRHLRDAKVKKVGADFPNQSDALLAEARRASERAEEKLARLNRTLRTVNECNKALVRADRGIRAAAFRLSDPGRCRRPSHGVGWLPGI